MKRCSRCEREIPDSATTCGQCDGHTVAPLPVKEQAAAPVTVVAVLPVRYRGPARGSGRRAPNQLADVRGRAPDCRRWHLRVRDAEDRASRCSRSGANRHAETGSAQGRDTCSHTVRHAAAPDHAVAAPVVAPMWNAANREWLLNTRKGVAFEVPSLNKVKVWQGVSQPMLVIRCDAGHMQTFVYTSSALQMEAVDDNHTVRISFDGEPEVTERWPDSSDHDALFAPDATAFARRISAARTLKFGYTPHNAQKAVAEFQVSGLTALLEPAAKPCGLKN